MVLFRTLTNHNLATFVLFRHKLRPLKLLIFNLMLLTHFQIRLVFGVSQHIQLNHRHRGSYEDAEVLLPAFDNAFRVWTDCFIRCGHAKFGFPGADSIERTR